MSSSNILAAKDVNTTFANANNNDSTTAADQPIKPDTMSMEYHRQVLQSKMEQDEKNTYVSPSDTIMSPCTAKLSSFRSKQISKSAKPKSLFAQASAKKLQGEGGPLFASKPQASASSSSN
ncbi:protein BNS1 [Podospora australis]|uniref:Protein BNS1 n=1 Tax=Podospora australis TaxID=1536484 RepID=A0AAN6X168_9PEZI|nr:protein BNS1 [Podospora australis]